MGYSRAGFDVVGVDIKPQPNYPFEFVQADALEVLSGSSDNLDLAVVAALDGHGFDAIHASPPCQRWSSKTKDHDAHADLITPLRPLLESTGLPYVIENVPAAPLEGPILCGSSFGLGVQRHRRFETTWPLLIPSCAHKEQPERFLVYDHGKWYLSRFVPVYGSGGGKSRGHWSEAMGIDWMTDDELREAIPPSYTELIGHQLLQHIKAKAVA